MTQAHPTRLVEAHWPHEYNHTTALLVGLTVAVQVAAVAIAAHSGWHVDLPAIGGVEAASGASLGLFWVVESLILIGLVMAWRWAPEWVRVIAIRIWNVSIYGGTLIWALMSEQYMIVLMVVGVIAAGIAIMKAAESKYWWLPFNCAGLALGALVAAIVGSALPPVAVLVLFAVMVLWDEIAVNYTPLMKLLAGGMASPFLPNVIVIPTGWCCDLRSVLDDALDDESDADARSIIGVGDFAIPGALAVSAYLSFGPWVAALAVFGTAIGMVELHSTVLQTERTHPGLPNLCGGAFGGFIVGLVGVAVV